MAIRVLSGVLVTRDHASGTATIHFNDHRVTGTLTRADKTQELGPSGRFEHAPCKVVAMREIKIREGESLDYRDVETDYLRIDDTVINRDRLEIEWLASGGSRIEEISYMIIGEVPD